MGDGTTTIFSMSDSGTASSEFTCRSSRKFLVWLNVVVGWTPPQPRVNYEFSKYACRFRIRSVKCVHHHLEF